MLETGVLVRDANGAPQCLAVTAIDITERRALEASLQQAHKMEAIGTLAGGIAHDFNNILGGILGGLSLLDLQWRESGQPNTEVPEMMALVKRGVDLTRQLLGFARRGKYDVRPLDLPRVVEKTTSMFGRTRRDIAIRVDSLPGLWPVLMDHSQLEQVLLNLLINAGQAMPEGGTICLKAENREIADDEAEMELRGAAPGRFVKLVIADSGLGMDAVTKVRVFEPFFTTKGIGQGTGLGLASVYGIIKGHGGVIQVDSEPGKGTVFTLLLPATDERPAEGSGPPESIERGTGTILVVDDEDVVLGICARMLKSLGYEVLTAWGGTQAVEIVREHGAKISLVILDMVMPGMTGRQTFDALRKLAPSIKILLSSGYSLEGQAQEILAQGCNGFLQKPFDLRTLSAKLRDII